jgi:hypothetical protein
MMMVGEWKRFIQIDSVAVVHFPKRSDGVQSMSETGTQRFKPPGNEYFYPPVRPDPMRLAIDTFWAVLRNTPATDRKLFRKAAAKVEKVVQEYWRNQIVVCGPLPRLQKSDKCDGLRGLWKMGYACQERQC